MYIVVLKTLAIFGGVFITFILVCAAAELLERLNNIITKRKRLYLIKHRFDKPPLAECYCKDCFRFTYKDPNDLECRNGYCSKFRRLDMPDYGFCEDATPDLKRGDEK